MTSEGGAVSDEGLDIGFCTVCGDTLDGSVPAAALFHEACADEFWALTGDEAPIDDIETRGDCACEHDEALHVARCQGNDEGWVCRCPRWEPLRSGEEYLAQIAEARRVARESDVTP